MRDEGETIGFNYLSKTYFVCSIDLLTLLAEIDDWTEADRVRLIAGSPSTELFDAQIEALKEVRAIVVEDSEFEDLENEFMAQWSWGMPAAMLHNTVQDRPYLTLADNEKIQRDQLAAGDPPDLYLRRIDHKADQIKLQETYRNDPVLSLMSSRRTVRTTDKTPIKVDELSDCLFAGLGITGTTTNEAGVTLPLSMTPSGGARNPFEAFVYVRDVEDLPSGFYHYSAFDHALERIETTEEPPISQLLGGQDWAEVMPCLILLCAYFKRSMWKYKDANAYRVVLIEAGHIGQNIMLAATRHGLSACPSAAINHSQISDCLGLGNTFDTAPIYALTLSKPVPIQPS